MYLFYCTFLPHVFPPPTPLHIWSSSGYFLNSRRRSSSDRPSELRLPSHVPPPPSAPPAPPGCNCLTLSLTRACHQAPSSYVSRRGILTIRSTALRQLASSVTASVVLLSGLCTFCWIAFKRTLCCTNLNQAFRFCAILSCRLVQLWIKTTEN